MRSEILPVSRGLDAHVMCHWNLVGEAHDTPVMNTIVPDGTMKLIFHYGDPYLHQPRPGVWVDLPRCFLIGQLTKPYVVRPVGRTGSFVVRFHPGGFQPFWGGPLKAFENTAVPLETLFGHAGAELGRRVLLAQDTGERIDVVEGFLFDRLLLRQEADAVITRTLAEIRSANGTLTVDELSRRINVHRRQLSRKFAAFVGLSPKQFSRTVRLHSALRRLRFDGMNDLTGLAYESAFFDQAHFIKEFNAFTGLTPKSSHSEILRMSLIFDGMEHDRTPQPTVVHRP
jgi:AraC-like DNA-binding protein